MCKQFLFVYKSEVETVILGFEGGIEAIDIIIVNVKKKARNVADINSAVSVNIAMYECINSRRGCKNVFHKIGRNRLYDIFARYQRKNNRADDRQKAS